MRSATPRCATAALRGDPESAHPLWGRHLGRNPCFQNRIPVVERPHMKRIVPAAVFLLMVSVGMSLRPRDVVAELRRMEWQHGAGLVPATFMVPAALALLLGHILLLQPAKMAGLFFVARRRGWLIRNIAKRGFDMQLAAGYQLWAGLLTPIVLQVLLTWWLPLAVMLLALGSVLAISLLAAERRAVGETYPGDLQCQSACAVGRAAERTAGGSGGRRREAWLAATRPGSIQLARTRSLARLATKSSPPPPSWNCVD